MKDQEEVKRWTAKRKNALVLEGTSHNPRFLWRGEGSVLQSVVGPAKLRNPRRSWACGVF